MPSVGSGVSSSEWDWDLDTRVEAYIFALCSVSHLKDVKTWITYVF